MIRILKLANGEVSVIEEISTLNGVRLGEHARFPADSTQDDIAQEVLELLASLCYDCRIERSHKNRSERPA